MWQIILTVIFYIWLFLVLGFLWAIWRDTSHYIRELQKTLVDSTLKTAEATQRTAEAVHLLVERTTPS